MKDSAYIDTSALAKWYFAESHSDQFTKYITKLDTAIISSLTKVEMRCLMARRQRMKQLTPMLEGQVYATFENDLEQGHLLLYTIDESIYERARHLLTTFHHISLRTLDALHLAVVQFYRIKQLATADEAMALAAKEMDLEVKFF